MFSFSEVAHEPPARHKRAFPAGRAF